MNQKDLILLMKEEIERVREIAKKSYPDWAARLSGLIIEAENCIELNRWFDLTAMYVELQRIE